MDRGMGTTITLCWTLVLILPLVYGKPEGGRLGNGSSDGGVERPSILPPVFRPGPAAIPEGGSDVAIPPVATRSSTFQVDISTPITGWEEPSLPGFSIRSVDPPVFPLPSRLTPVVDAPVLGTEFPLQTSELAVPDRKSTRLNSSHWE